MHFHCGYPPFDSCLTEESNAARSGGIRYDSLGTTNTSFRLPTRIRSPGAKPTVPARIGGHHASGGCAAPVFHSCQCPPSAPGSFWRQLSFARHRRRRRGHGCGSLPDVRTSPSGDLLGLDAPDDLTGSSRTIREDVAVGRLLELAEQLPFEAACVRYGRRGFNELPWVSSPRDGVLASCHSTYPSCLDKRYED